MVFNRYFVLVALFGLSYLPQNAQAAQAIKYYKDYFPSAKAYCVEGCSQVVRHLTFNFTTTLDPLEDYYAIQCSNPLLVQSIYLCAQVYCSPDEIIAGIAGVSSDCEEYGGVTLPSFDTYALPSEALAKVPVVNDTAGSTSAAQPLNYPVVPNEEWWARGARTIVRQNAISV